jgi:hypothetical protein
MAYNSIKLIVVGILALAAIAAAIIDPNQHLAWAIPLLTLLAGYITGNAHTSTRTGTTAPIIAIDVKA